MRKKTLQEKFQTALVQQHIFQQDLPPEELLAVAKKHKLPLRYTLLLWEIIQNRLRSLQELAEASSMKDEMGVENAFEDKRFQSAFMDYVTPISNLSPEKLEDLKQNLLRLLRHGIQPATPKAPSKKQPKEAIQIVLPPTNK